MQAHKEERFMWPAYPLVGLNACVSLFLIRGWVENGYAKVTRSSWRVSRRVAPQKSRTHVPSAYAY